MPKQILLVPIVILYLMLCSCPNGGGIKINIVKQLVDKQFYVDSVNGNFFQILGDKKFRISNTLTYELMVKQNHEKNFNSFSNSPTLIRTSELMLAAYETVNHKSLSPTPSSIVFPPVNSNGEQKPLTDLTKATKIISQGQEVQLLELRGWLRDVSSSCNVAETPGADWHYYLELDLEWANQAGFTNEDIHKLIRVGTIKEAESVSGASSFINAICTPSDDFFNLISLPLIKIEFNSYGWKGWLINGKPNDWTATSSSCSSLIWPYHPLLNGQITASSFAEQIDTNNHFENRRGQYVKMFGSIVTDHPHGGNVDLANPQNWQGAVNIWGSAFDNDPNHPARWTEMHPPDYIEVLPFKKPKYAVRALALLGPVTTAINRMEFDIYPDRDGIEKPNQSSTLHFEELRGPESVNEEDNASFYGLTIENRGDHIHVSAFVKGKFILNKSKLKSIIKVWWE